MMRTDDNKPFITFEVHGYEHGGVDERIEVIRKELEYRTGEPVSRSEALKEWKRRESGKSA